MLITSCAVEGCSNLAYKTGLCNRHYIKKRRYGDPLISRQRPKGIPSRIEIREGHARVELTQGKWAIIDIEDAEHVGQFAWCYISSGYAYSHQARLLLHQFLIGKAPLGYETDHENRDKLDCRRENIRHITYHENNRNSDKNDGSGWCTFDVVRNKWKAIFKWNGRTVYSGYFTNKADATKASREARARLAAEGDR